MEIYNWDTLFFIAKFTFAIFILMMLELIYEKVKLKWKAKKTKI